MTYRSVLTFVSDVNKIIIIIIIIIIILYRGLLFISALVLQVGLLHINKTRDESFLISRSGWVGPLIGGATLDSIGFRWGAFMMGVLLAIPVCTSPPHSRRGPPLGGKGVRVHFIYVMISLYHNNMLPQESSNTKVNWGKLSEIYFARISYKT